MPKIAQIAIYLISTIWMLRIILIRVTLISLTIFKVRMLLTKAKWMLIILVALT